MGCGVKEVTVKDMCTDRSLDILAERYPTTEGTDGTEGGRPNKTSQNTETRSRSLYS